MSFHTTFGSLASYEKGHIEIINDNPKYYVFSNVFEVAAKSKPYEKVAVAKNLEYVVEASAPRAPRRGWRAPTTSSRRDGRRGHGRVREAR